MSHRPSELSALAIILECAELQRLYFSMDNSGEEASPIPAK